MSVYIDRKYLLFLSSRLERFAQKKDDLYNFRCPYCGDSQKNKLKARGYVHRKDNDYYYMCHNCGFSTTFSKFLKHIDEGMYKQYALERYSNGENGHSNYKKPEFNLSGPKPSERLIKKSKLPLQKISELPDDHDAKQYILNRKIPSKFYDDIYYSENIEKVINSHYPEVEVNFSDSDRRIVLFHTDIDENITYIVGRSIELQPQKRYVKVKVNDGEKIFGLNRINRSKKIYIVEGQFDSMFIDNAVASGDSNLIGIADKFDKDDVVLVYDNERRNIDINKLIARAIDMGYAVSLFPETIKYKDINDMVLHGYTPCSINEIIVQNTFSGLTAKLRHSAWKKC